MRQVHLLQLRTSFCVSCGRMRGSVIASASNQRWSSGVLEVGCWNGEAVRILRDRHLRPRDHRLAHYDRRDQRRDGA
jgi:hypothetical protein